MKRYTVIDNIKNRKNDYSSPAWEIAWWSVFLIGVFVGAIISH